MLLYKVTSSCPLLAQGQQTHGSVVSSLWDVDARRDEKCLSSIWEGLQALSITA